MVYVDAEDKEPTFPRENNELARHAVEPGWAARISQRLYPVVVVVNVASCSHGYPIICHFRRDWEIDHNFRRDYNLVLFSLYINYSVYHLSTSLVLAAELRVLRL